MGLFYPKLHCSLLTLILSEPLWFYLLYTKNEMGKGWFIMSKKYTKMKKTNNNFNQNNSTAVLKSHIHNNVLSENADIGN